MRQKRQNKVRLNRKGEVNWRGREEALDSRDARRRDSRAFLDSVRLVITSKVDRIHVMPSHGIRQDKVENLSFLNIPSSHRSLLNSTVFVSKRYSTKK